MLNVLDPYPAIKPPAPATVRVALPVGGTLRNDLITRLKAACDEVEQAVPGAALWLHLAGGAELAGEAVEGHLDVHLVSTWEKALRRVERLAAPTIATAAGCCGGIGLAILLATDYRIAAPDLRLSLRLGSGAILPGMALHRIANQIGVARSRQLALFGTELSAPVAQEIGLVNAVAPDLEAAAAEFVGGLQKADLQDLAIRRRLLLEASALSYEEGLGSYLAACDRLLR